MYHIGKDHLDLDLDLKSCDEKIKNKYISSQLFDDKSIENKKFYHCVFANISFKNAKLKDLSFLNCVFFNCYFKEAEIENCEITGCKFIDCNFRKIKISSKEDSTFQYSCFKNCYVPYDVMEKNLPIQPNISEEMVRNLEIETYQLGAYEEYLKYKRKRISLDEKRLGKAFHRADDWNKGHYTRKESWGALLDWLWSKFKGFIWGHGENGWKLLASFLVLVFLLPFVFLLTYGVSFGNAILVSFENIFSVNTPEVIQLNSQLSLRILLLIQKIGSISYVALFISLFTRRILKK